MDIIKTENFLKLPPHAYKKTQRAITIGNFDGCHLGHIKLLKQTLSIAKKNNLRATVLTFDPPPSSILKKLKKKQIFTITQKINFLKELGFEEIVIQKFSNEFSMITHKEFYSEGLKNTLGTKAIVVGTDFCFGSQRKGTITWLKKTIKQDTIQLHIIQKKKINKTIISSTLIRSLLEKKEIERANEMLNYPFQLEGKIEKGKQKGRTLGFPTANLTNIMQIIPGSGVYSGYTWIQEKHSDLPPFNPNTNHHNIYRSVINIGYNPTIETSNKQIRVESHIFEKKFPLDYLYDKNTLFYFKYRIRNEKMFTKISDLQKQIKIDIDVANSTLR